MIEILCSGISLGHYVPGLLIRDRLRRLGIESRVLVYESLLDQAHRDRIDHTQQAYHSSFRLALTGQRLAKNLAPSIHYEFVERAISEWLQHPPIHIIVLSGYWVPLVSRLINERQEWCKRIELCHIDSSNSPVWAAQAQNVPFKHTWLISADPPEVRYRIPIDAPAIEFPKLAGRILVHGGGWGIGNYRDVIPDLLKAGFKVDLVVYCDSDLGEPLHGLRYLAIGTRWRPWYIDANGDATYPPLVETSSAPIPDRIAVAIRHEVFDHIAGATAIVSKPGGATLLDSLAAATPVVFLQPYGQHESVNAALWEALGFGISIDAWRQQHMSIPLLETLRANLQRARLHTPSYPDYIARRLELVQ